MKKFLTGIVAIVLVFVCFCSVIVANAEESFNYKEVFSPENMKRVCDELDDDKNTIILFPGDYVVGKHIDVGCYLATVVGYEDDDGLTFAEIVWDRSNIEQVDVNKVPKFIDLTSEGIPLEINYVPVVLVKIN